MFCGDILTPWRMKNTRDEIFVNANFCYYLTSMHAKMCNMAWDNMLPIDKRSFLADLKCITLVCCTRYNGVDGKVLLCHEQP